MPKFSVVIPTYNEEGILKDTLSEVHSFFSSLGPSFEIMLVNDGSTDKTESIAKKLSKKMPDLEVLSHLPNLGKGYSVREGMLSAKGEIILFTDCDLSTPLKTFTEFLPHFERGADVVIGSRRQKESKILITQPRPRRFLNEVFHRLVFFLVPLKNITDTTCGFKAFTREAAKKIFSGQKIPGWGFDAEILYIAQLLGYEIIEVPVSWSNRKESRVRLARAPLTTLKELITIRGVEDTSSSRHTK